MHCCTVLKVVTLILVIIMVTQEMLELSILQLKRAEGFQGLPDWILSMNYLLKELPMRCSDFFVLNRW